MDAVKPTNRPSTKGEQTRRVILDAAITRFGRDGYRGTSVADIAREARVSGTAAYAYFADKEALFLAAVDEDAAAVIEEGVSHLLEGDERPEWRRTLIFTLVTAVDRHPLARRMLAGLEPDITARVLDIPALAELRKAVAERLRAEQASGSVRVDIDPVAIANGMVSVVLALLMSVVQLGVDSARPYADDVAAVIDAALAPIPPNRR